jgi:hypothetical protein
LLEIVAALAVVIRVIGCFWGANLVGCATRSRVAAGTFAFNGFDLQVQFLV